eukprot:3223485-Rhodomonas_salina.8
MCGYAPQAVVDCDRVRERVDLKLLRHLPPAGCLGPHSVRTPSSSADLPSFALMSHSLLSAGLLLTASFASVNSEHVLEQVRKAGQGLDPPVAALLP